MHQQMPEVWEATASSYNDVATRVWKRDHDKNNTDTRAFVTEHIDVVLLWCTGADINTIYNKDTTTPILQETLNNMYRTSKFLKALFEDTQVKATFSIYRVQVAETLDEWQVSDDIVASAAECEALM